MICPFLWSENLLTEYVAFGGVGKYCDVLLSMYYCILMLSVNKQEITCALGNSGIQTKEAIS